MKDVKYYYSLLGISPGASDEEIKKGYREMAKKYHPDKNTEAGAKEKFQEVQEAYDTLSDPVKKNKYDNPKPAPHYNTNSGTWSHRDDWARDFSAADYSSIFDTVYGSSFRKKGMNISRDLNISLNDVYTGCTKTIWVDGESHLVNVKPGLRDNYKIVIKGKGKKGSAEPGDLFINIFINNDEKFIRKNNDLYCALEVDLYTAVLGGEAFLDIFGTTIKITIPEGSQNGKMMRIPGKGMPILTNPDKKGNLFFEIKVSVPTNLTEGEKDLFRVLRDFGR